MKSNNIQMEILILFYFNMLSLVNDLKNFSVDQLTLLAHFYQLPDDLSIHNLLTTIAQENLRLHTQPHSAKMLTAEETELLKLRSYGSQPFIERFVNHYKDDFKTTWRRCYELENAKISRDAKVCDVIQDPIEKAECIKEMKNPCDWYEWFKQHSENLEGKILTAEAKNDLNISLIAASKKGLLNVVRRLLKFGADVRAKRDAPLQLAARAGHPDVVRLLIEKGANVHAAGDFALQLASSKGHLEVVRLLIEKGADVYSSGDFALQLAAENGHPEMVRLLIEKGVDVHSSGDVALQLAAENDHIEMVKLLIEKGVDVRAAEDEALKLAAKYGHPEMVRLLIEKGADVHASGDLALQLAAENDHPEVVRLLIEKGADTTTLQRDEDVIKMMRKLKTDLI